MRKKKKGIYTFGRYIPMSAHKAQRVFNQIRGRYCEEALQTLMFMPYRACDPIINLIQDAIANADHNEDLDITELIIGKVEVNKGTQRKKLKPRAKGRNSIIKRSTCHITIVLQRQIFLLQLKNSIFSISKQESQIIWSAVRFSDFKVLDDTLFSIIMRGG
uniref:ribosomal protein L22 n=1 Tax=Neoraimondia herzogiana TaxID=176269 RepID=UPI0030034764|nr:ribosomal protein L22 [Neoraimondia herzogiana]